MIIRNVKGVIVKSGLTMLFGLRFILSKDCYIEEDHNAFIQILNYKIMKTIYFILIILLGLSFAGYCLYLLRKEYKKMTARTPNDDLYDLDWKIESTLVNDPNELYFISRIKELRLKPEVNQERLNVLDRKFRDKFQILHNDIEFFSTLDPHSPDNLDFSKLKKSINWKNIRKQDDVDLDYSRVDGK